MSFRRQYVTGRTLVYTLFLNAIPYEQHPCHFRATFKLHNIESQHLLCGLCCVGLRCDRRKEAGSSVFRCLCMQSWQRPKESQLGLTQGSLSFLTQLLSERGCQGQLKWWCGEQNEGSRGAGHVHLAPGQRGTELTKGASWVLVTGGSKGC